MDKKVVKKIKKDKFWKKKNYFILFFIPIVLFLFLFFIPFQKNKIKSNKIESDIAKKINSYYLSWIEFGKLTGQDIVEKWNSKYFYCEYKLAGNIKKGKADCSTSVFNLLQDLGANVKIQRITILLKSLDEITIQRKRLKDINNKDIIILYIKGSYHMGIIVRKYKNKLYYVDVNVADNGFGYKRIMWKDKRIKGIYPISFKMWIGNLLDNYIEF